MSVDDLPQASEAAINLAEANDVDLSNVPATGADGQITQQDVQRYLKDNPPNPDAGGDEGEGDGEEAAPAAPVGPRLNWQKPYATCHGREDKLSIIQSGKGFTADGRYLGKVDPATNELTGEQ